MAAAFLIGFSCMFIFGVHGRLSGTASMDFGGRKAAATAAGMLDGIPFSLAGAFIMTRIWNAKPGQNVAH